MATEVGALYYDIDAKDNNLKAKLDEADKNVKRLGDSATTNFDKFQKGAKVAAVGLGVVGAGLTLYAKNATDYTVGLLKSSKALGSQIGVSTTEASRLVAAVGRMGVEADNASQMFGIFSKQIVASSSSSESNRLAQQKLKIEIDKTKQSIANTTSEIAKNGDKSGELKLKLQDLNNTLASQRERLNQSADAFAKLGISTKDGAGRQKDFNTLLFEVADKFKTMPNGIDKTALAMQLFGRQGKDMIKVLNLGSQGIQDLEKQADRMGLTLNANTITSIENLISKQKDLKQETDAMKIAVGTATAPVLTDFTSKVNGLIMALLNSDGPLRTITVDFLAFGGPVAGGASALLAFIANVDQTRGTLSALGSGIVGLIGLIRSPWVLAFIAGGAALALVTGALFGQKSAADQLASAHNNLKNSIDLLRNAELGLEGAQLNEKRAAFEVKDAQARYNDAVRRFGPNSDAAKRAMLDLRQAQLNLKLAHQQTIDKMKDYKKQEDEVAKNKSLEDHLKRIRTQLQGVGSDAFNAGQTITNQFTGRTVTVKTSKNAVGQQTINFVQTFGKRAGGGPVEAGRQYLTGEQGPELFVPRQSGTIIPADLTKKIMSGGNAQPNHSTRFGDTIVNIGEVNNQQDENYVLRRINRNQQLEAFGMSPIGI